MTAVRAAIRPSSTAISAVGRKALYPSSSSTSTNISSRRFPVTAFASSTNLRSNIDTGIISRHHRVLPFHTRSSNPSLLGFGKKFDYKNMAMMMSSSCINTSTTSTTIDDNIDLSFSFEPQAATDEEQISNIIFIGRKSVLSDAISKEKKKPSFFQDKFKMELSDIDVDAISYMVNKVSGGPSGGTASSLMRPSNIQTPLPFLKCSVVSLPNKVSRNNHIMSPHLVTDKFSVVCDKKTGGGDTSTNASSSSDSISDVEEEGNASDDEESIESTTITTAKVFIIGASVKSAGALSAAISRAFPLYNSKSSSSNSSKGKLKIDVCFLDDECNLLENNDANHEAVINSCNAVSNGVRLAARLVDTPPAELTPDIFSDECHEIASNLGDSVTIEEVKGDDLLEKGYGGIHGVGRAAICPPRMILMTYTPPEYDETIHETVALAGKGVIYDTGGLALKSKVGMCNMKTDMGGAAGLLGGFQAAVQLQLPKKIILGLAIVENAIGPDSFRNDDVLRMYSGKTVEINNTDAEGRLILADIVAHLTKHTPGLKWILDMATLTGAQGISTGKKHAAVLANTEELEKKAFNAGLRSADFCYPILYAPELLKQEFSSKIADMKNSVKDRANAQCSCAGHFIESHIDSSYEGDGWIHIDMAYPGVKNERGTGYGVGLTLAMLDAPGFD